MEREKLEEIFYNRITDNYIDYTEVFSKSEKELFKECYSQYLKDKVTIDFKEYIYDYFYKARKEICEHLFKKSCSIIVSFIYNNKINLDFEEEKCHKIFERCYEIFENEGLAYGDFDGLVDDSLLDFVNNLLMKKKQSKIEKETISLKINKKLKNLFYRSFLQVIHVDFGNIPGFYDKRFENETHYIYFVFRKYFFDYIFQNIILKNSVKVDNILIHYLYIKFFEKYYEKIFDKYCLACLKEITKKGYRNDNGDPILDYFPSFYRYLKQFLKEEGFEDVCYKN